MSALRLVGVGLGGYLLGTIPSAALAARAASEGRLDLRDYGSRNPGAMNALHTLGRGYGLAVAAADVAKGAVACGAGRRLAGGAGAHLAGVAAVTGHCYPIWSGFRHGGKGVATSVGQCLATFPAYAPLDFAIGILAASHMPPRRRALTTTVAAAASWIVGGVLWWRRSLPNAWGPEPTAALPLANLASTVVILSRFAAASRSRHEDDLGDRW
jgi:glycerol-3-phosphate acyltransferase PlsY